MASPWGSGTCQVLRDPWGLVQHCHSSLIEFLIGQGNHMTNQEKLLHSYYTTAVKTFNIAVSAHLQPYPTLPHSNSIILHIHQSVTTVAYIDHIQ